MRGEPGALRSEQGDVDDDDESHECRDYSDLTSIVCDVEAEKRGHGSAEWRMERRLRLSVELYSGNVEPFSRTSVFALVYK